MKKFYESPVVELTGFSAEDVITTSAIAPVVSSSTLEGAEAEAFETAVKSMGYAQANRFGSGSYQW